MILGLKEIQLRHRRCLARSVVVGIPLSESHHEETTSLASVGDVSLGLSLLPWAKESLFMPFRQKRVDLI
jgi:hypothetical protein